MPKITIIVPIYNTANVLRRSVDSIIAQTYTDWELLLIDDGSNDGSGNICDEYAASDSRIRVIHQPNGGVSAARNRGIDEAQGTWVGFVDSDDYVEPCFLQNFMSLPQDVDMLQQGLCALGSWWNIPAAERTVVTMPDRMVRGRDEMLVFVNDMYDCDMHPYTVCKLFRRDLLRIHGLRFQEDLRYQEDMLFNFNYYSHITSAANIQAAGYNYFFPTNGKEYKSRRPLWVYRQCMEAMLTPDSDKHEAERLRIQFLRRMTNYCFRADSFATAADRRQFFIWMGKEYSRREMRISLRPMRLLQPLRMLYVKHPAVSLPLLTATYFAIALR
ncbi:MAG: glycosyltransferase, partial [Bacteroidales bacterium]|nr:glycosyltransferase [Bacteroidales bacterium]